MILKLLVKNGPLAGQQFDLKAGATIGRAKTDIRLEDVKMSGKHAKIETDPSGNWILVDLGSTNGIKINGKRLAQVSLADGLLFRLGNTDIEVISAPDPAIASTSPPPLPADAPGPEAARREPPAKKGPAPSDDAVDLADLKELVGAKSMETPTNELEKPVTAIDVAPEATKEEIVVQPPTWSEYLSAFSIRAQKKVNNDPKPLKPFDPLLLLNIVRGPQIGTTWVLGYGPRSIGIESVDLPLLDANAPEIAFVVTPKGTYAQFETLHPKKVRLNNKSVSSEILRSEDKISVGDTVIQVSYRE